MTEDKLTEEYLSNFPTVFHDALLNIPKVRRKFLQTIKTDYTDTKVYRAIHKANCIVDEDFLSHVEMDIKDGREEYRKDSVERYSVSVNTDRDQLITGMNIPNEERKLMGIASGIMKSSYGPADFPNNKTHHNWYLFKGVGISLKNEFEVEIVNTQ